MEKIKYCLEERVTNIRLDVESEELIAEDLKGNQVYVREEQYKFDGTADGKRYYILRNRL